MAAGCEDKPVIRAQQKRWLWVFDCLDHRRRRCRIHPCSNPGVVLVVARMCHWSQSVNASCSEYSDLSSSDVCACGHFAATAGNARPGSAQFRGDVAHIRSSRYLAEIPPKLRRVVNVSRLGISTAKFLGKAGTNSVLLLWRARVSVSVRSRLHRTVASSDWTGTRTEISVGWSR
jgi:hypothetical protein